MRDYTFERKKATTSTFSNPSLVSPHTPTLANPVRGFGLPTNNVIQTQTSESTEQEVVQAADKKSKLLQALDQPSFGHHISRIAIRRPQAKLTMGEPGDKYEQEADWMANQVMRMVIPDKPNADSVQPVDDTLQRKCAACEEEEEKIQTKPSIQPASDGDLQAGDNIESQLNSSKGGGSPLPDEVRSFMEPRFGAAEKKPVAGPCQVKTVPRLGGNPDHDAYATKVTGSINDYWVKTPEGIECTTDGKDVKDPMQLWEVKTGHEWATDEGQSSGAISSYIDSRIVELEEQRARCTGVTRRCGYKYAYAFNKESVVNYVGGMWSNNPPVFYISP